MGQGNFAGDFILDRGAFLSVFFGLIIGGLIFVMIYDARNKGNNTSEVSK